LDKKYYFISFSLAFKLRELLKVFDELFCRQNNLNSLAKKKPIKGFLGSEYQVDISEENRSGDSLFLGILITLDDARNLTH